MATANTSQVQQAINCFHLSILPSAKEENKYMTPAEPRSLMHGKIKQMKGVPKQLSEHTELQHDLQLPSAIMQLLQRLFLFGLVKSIQNIGTRNKLPFLLPLVQLRPAAIADVSWPML